VSDEKKKVASPKALSWFEKLIPARISARSDDPAEGSVPEGVWVKCDNCANVLYHAELERAQDVCIKCSHHIRIGARKRLERLLDEDGRDEIGASVQPVDALKFKDSKRYKDRLSAATKSSGETDALVVMRGSIHGVPVVAAVFDFNFMAGSMGSVVGERFCQAMQMGKTSSMLTKLSDQGLPYISVLTDPTMGGVSASLAMLGDVIIAEPGARIGFAGPRVIEQTVRETLPDGFQSAEFLVEHGAVDMIVDRREMRPTLAKVLAKLTGAAAIDIEAGSDEQKAPLAST